MTNILQSISEGLLVFYFLSSLSATLSVDDFFKVLFLIDSRDSAQLLSILQKKINLLIPEFMLYPQCNWDQYFGKPCVLFL